MRFILTFTIFFLINSVFAQNRVDSLSNSITYLNRDFQLSKLNLQNIPNVEKVPEFQKELDWGYLALGSGITLAAGLGVHFYQANAWWQDQSAEFHVVNDWKYARGIDKFGHFYATQLLAHGFSTYLETTNLSEEHNAILSSSLAFLFEIYVEIEDGYGPNWGFSPGDATMDFLGASYYSAQYYFPLLNNFQPRISYYPTKKVLEGNTNAIIIDDYEGQTFWIATRIEKLLPKNYRDFWPNWLMLSVGTSARNLDGAGGGINEFYLALDYDPLELPIHGKFANFIKNSLNYVHFPMPGIRISPNFAGFAIVY